MNNQILKRIVVLSLLILLCSCKAGKTSSPFVAVKFIEATLTYNNGTTKKCFAEKVDMNYSKVKFKLTEKGTTEEVMSDELKKIEYIEKEGGKSIAERLYLYKDKEKSGIKKVEKKWFYLLYSNGLKLASNYSSSTLRYNAGNGTSSGSGGETYIHIGRENEDGVFFLYVLSDMMSVNVGLDKSVRKNCELLFKDCPAFLTAVNEEKFKKNTLITRLVELYETNNCNKKEEVKAVKKPSTKAAIKPKQTKPKPTKK